MPLTEQLISIGKCNFPALNLKAHLSLKIPGLRIQLQSEETVLILCMLSYIFMCEKYFYNSMLGNERI